MGPVIDDIQKAYSDWRSAVSDSELATKSAEVNEDEIARFKLLVNREKGSMKEIYNSIKSGLDPEGQSRIENIFYELNINNYRCGLEKNDGCGWLGGYFNRGLFHLLTLRSDLLTLILVILMGVLGSALQISHAFFTKNQVQSIGGYFQRISVGAMTALVIFIVAKAGVPIIADSARLGGDAAINPYFVSFLAIVSGLLSENAIANIQEQGARLFGQGSGEPDRWARTDLTPDFAERGVSVAQFASQLGVVEETATEMLAGNGRFSRSSKSS